MTSNLLVPDNLNQIINISKSNPNKLLVLDFTASWCGPCQTLAPKLEILASKCSNVSFFKINHDNPLMLDIFNHFNVSCMPSLVFLKNGKECTNKIVGLPDIKLLTNTVINFS
jgi:thioredoxin 1